MTAIAEQSSSHTIRFVIDEESALMKAFPRAEALASEEIVAAGHGELIGLALDTIGRSPDHPGFLEITATYTVR